MSKAGGGGESLAELGVLGNPPWHTQCSGTARASGNQRVLQPGAHCCGHFSSGAWGFASVVTSRCPLTTVLQGQPLWTSAWGRQWLSRRVASV